MNWNAIDACVETNGLLKHKFYQAWSAGQLKIEDLQHYAGQYYALETTFPRLLSAVHAGCDAPDIRQGILRNLADEELGEENHRELWLRFAEGLGLDREQVINAKRDPATQACIDKLMALAQNPNTVVGLSALYAYESQLPAVSDTKIKGLCDFYGITDDRALSFFTVHKTADVWHSEEEQKMIEALNGDQETVHSAAEAACQALLHFLDGVDAATRLKRVGADCVDVCMH